MFVTMEYQIWITNLFFKRNLKSIWHSVIPPIFICTYTLTVLDPTQLLSAYLVYNKHVFVSHLYVIHQNCIDFLHLALKLNAQTSSSIIGNHLLLKMIELTERFCDTILKTKVKSHFDFALFAGKLSIIHTIFLEWHFIPLCQNFIK